MTAKEYLSQYRMLDARIKSKQQQLSDLRERAVSVSGGNGNGSHSGTPYDRVGELTAKIVDREGEIARDIEALIQLQREIEHVISSVQDDRLKLLLELAYINGLKLGQVAEKMNYSQRQVRRLHGRALSAVNDVLECPI